MIFTFLSIMLLICDLFAMLAVFKCRVVEGNVFAIFFRNNESGRCWATKDKFTSKRYRLFRIGSRLAACGAFAPLKSLPGFSLEYCPLDIVACRSIKDHCPAISNLNQPHWKMHGLVPD
jgi:hypothetical protein